MTTVHCPHCGGVVQLAMLPVGQSAGAAAARAGQSAGAAAARAGQQQEEQAPMCANCGQRRVNRRNNGTWFRTCVRCG